MTRAKKPPNATRLVEKQRIARAGRRAERLCVWLLRLKGYRVLARNWRTPRDAIDIVARRRRVLVLSRSNCARSAATFARAGVAV